MSRPRPVFYTTVADIWMPEKEKTEAVKVSLMSHSQTMTRKHSYEKNESIPSTNINYPIN